MESHYKAKKLMTKMGLGYMSIHVCKNDCALFWKENSLKETCPVCLESRWKLQSGKRSRKNVPHKVLYYFPVSPRLKRLFVTSKTADGIVQESQRIMMLCDILSMARHGRNLINDTLNLPVI